MSQSTLNMPKQGGAAKYYKCDWMFGSHFTASANLTSLLA